MAQSGLLSRLFNTARDEVVKTYEPTPRSAHHAASLGGLVYSFAGNTDKFDNAKTSLSTHIEVFDPVTETWLQRDTAGDPPLGLCDGAFAASRSHLYHYGGHDGSSCHGDLSRFCPATMQWTNVSRHSVGGPMRKDGCRMICCGDILGLFGGFGIPTGTAHQQGSTFIKSKYSADGSGWSDEFHLFDINKGVWSSPATTGNRPFHRDNFSFTEIDDHRAVLFAGDLPGFVSANDTYLVDLQFMEWSKLDLVDGGPVPVERYGHAACCINVGDDHPLLLVTGGVSKDCCVLKDAWLLDIVARRWKELQMPEGFKPRYYHSLTATSLAPGITVATAFGGWRKWGRDPIAETTLLQFEQQAGQWGLTDVTLSIQLGREERVRDKRRKMEAAGQQHAPAQPQATSSPRPSQERQQVLEQRAQAAEMGQREAERKLHEAEQRERALQQRLQEAESHTQESDRLKRVYQQRAMEAEAATQDALQATVRSNQRIEELTQNLQTGERNLEEAQGMMAELQTAHNNLEGEASHVQREMANLHARLDEDGDLQRRITDLETQWVVERREIQLTEEEKGRGGWAVVRAANFRGLRVAAKCLHEQIRDYYRDLFIREMNMAARLRHPNLVQFIGATLQGEMIILTELMPTSLRAVLEQRAISHDEITSISLDVARALNYLHLMQPEPLIHRDISSANVLLEPLPNNSWKAKVSDYGSVNLQRQLRTVGPGSPVYAAPEANSPDQQSPKMDVFSFGVLLIEMCTARFPEVAARQRLIHSIQHPHFVELIGRCMSQEIASRPSASEIISQLTQL